MFRSALFKLTALYLLILLVISIAFSASLYHISTFEIDARLRRQSDFLQRVPGIATPNFDIMHVEQERKKELSDSKSHIFLQLLYANLAVVLLGGLGSYLLAKRTLKPIEEAHEAQTRFTADASHELRTPIAAMQAETEVALRNPKLSAREARELLASNLEELAKLTQLSEGLLQLARGNQDVDTSQTININSVIQEAVEKVSHQAHTKKITINTGGVSDTQLTGNYMQLSQLVVILLDNAIKYSEPKQSVDIKTESSDDLLTISVLDHGHGISQSSLKHIFDRFYRVDSARSKSKANGYGLGLSIAKQIVEAHYGSIDAKSMLGKGSTFIITLPLSKS